MQWMTKVMKVAEVIEKVSTNEYWSIYEFEKEFDLEVIDTCVGGYWLSSEV